MSPLKPREQFSPDYTLGRLLKGFDNLFEWFHAMRMYGKSIKNLLQNQESSESSEAWYIVSGTQGLPSLFK